MPPTLRKTRFVCISDTHNASPANGAFKLPKGDVLIHAGDLTNQGSLSELQKAVDWLEDADFEVKIVVAGNHEVTLDVEFYSQHGKSFHNQFPQSSVDCIQLLQGSPSIIYLTHNFRVIKLTKEGGPKTTFKAFGSPYSPARGQWAFSYTSQEARSRWDEIPLDADVVVTHTPAKYHCDESKHGDSAGCEDLRQALWRVRPRLAICGHIHEGRGVQRVRWGLRSTNIKYKEDRVTHWTDPGTNNQKQSYIDLSTAGGNPLINTDNEEDVPAESPQPDDLGLTLDSCQLEIMTSNHKASHLPLPQVANGSVVGLKDMRDDTPLKKLTKKPTTRSPKSATRGQGGMPLSGQCDLEALNGRLGRQETCVINAAIMASSWPHKGSGGKKYNKPIVVDVELPAWDDQSDI